MPIQKKKSRIINVDGVMYSLDTARPVAPSADAPRPDGQAKPISPIDAKKSSRGLDITRTPIRRDTPRLSAPPTTQRHQVATKESSQDPAQPSLTPAEAEPILPRAPQSSLPTEQSYQQLATRALKLHPRGVSHPTLPVSPSTRRSTPGRWWANVVWATTFKKSGGKIGQMAFGQALFSPLTWLLLTAPILAMWLLSWRNATLMDLSAIARTALSARNYWSFIIALVVVPILWSVLAGVSALFGLTIYGVRINQCDHRSVKPKALFGRILSRIERILLNWFYNMITVLLILAGAVGIIIWLLGMHNTDLNWLKPVLMAVTLLVGFVGLAHVYLIRPMQRGFLATIDERLSFIRPKSRGLVRHSFGKTVLAGCLALIVNVVTIGLVLVISWAQYTYLASPRSAVAQVAIILGGVSLSIVVLSVRLTWLQSFWASHFHFALLQSPNGHTVAVLNQPTRQRRRISGLLRLALIYLVLAGVIVGAGFYFQSTVGKNLEHIDRVIPQDFNQLIPKNN